MLALGTAGCAAPEPTLPPPPGPTYTLPAVAWAGAQFVVTSSAGFPAGAEVEIDLAGQRLPLTHLTASTRGVELPVSLAGGETPVTLHLDDTAVTLGTILVAGHSGGHRFEHFASYDAYHWPRDGAASVLAQNNEGLSLYDLDASTMTVLPVPSNSDLHGPGATPDPDVFLLQDGADIESWRLRPVPVQVATWPELAGQPMRHLMLMSATVLFHSPGQHWYDIWARSSVDEMFASVLDHVDAEETGGVYLSPRGDRAIIRVRGVDTGVPVFDASTGMVAYRLPLMGTMGVDFSPAGDRLLVGGSDLEDHRDTHRVLVIDPTDGSVLVETTFTLPVAAVAWDPDRPYVYVALADETQGPILQVLEKSTLAKIGEMRPEGIVESPSLCCDGAVIAPSRTSNTVHLFWGRWSLRFEMPPE